MPPVHESMLLVEEELGLARTWIEHKEIQIDWEPSELRIRTVLTQPVTREPFYLEGVFEDYKELPPRWEFYDEAWAKSGRQALYPSREPCPFPSSIFHSHAYVCAHFNVLAYADNRHDRWGDPENWRNVEEKHATATTVGGMLQHIHRHLTASRGRMG